MPLEAYWNYMYAYMHIVLKMFLSKFMAMPAVFWDRELIQSLFEDWVQAGEDWASSTIVINASRSHEESQIGTHKMKTFREIQQQFGTLADTIRATKKEMQKNRKPGEPVYHMKHPDCPDDEESRLC